MAILDWSIFGDPPREGKRFRRLGMSERGNVFFALLVSSLWVCFLASSLPGANASSPKESWLALVREDHSVRRMEKMGIRLNVVHGSSPNRKFSGGKLSGMKIYEFVSTKEEAMSMMYETKGVLDSSVWYLERNHPVYVVGNRAPKREKDRFGGNANKKNKWLDDSTDAVNSASAQDCRFSNYGGIPGFNPGYFSWGIDLLDQQSSSPNLEYCPLNGMTGQGIDVHMIDTGIYMHSTLDGDRITKAFDFFEPDSSASDFCLDAFGHGTHTSCLVASSSYGGAPSVNLYVYKVLNDQGSGSLASLASGLAAIYDANHTKGIISMSLGAGNVVSTVVSTYVQALMQERGFVVVVAAGNGDEDACENFPANIPGVVSVGAIDILSSRDTDYSNYGTCVSLFSPGTNIISCGISNPESSQIMTGTSMATPIVTSACAVLWQAYPYYDAAQITSVMLQNTVKNSVSNAGTGSPNYRVYDGSVNVATLPDHTTPSPTPTSSPHPTQQPPPSPPSGGESIPNESASLVAKSVWFYFVVFASLHLASMQI